MNEKIKQREIEKCKETLKNPLGYNERISLEAYLKSLEGVKPLSE